MPVATERLGLLRQSFLGVRINKDEGHPLVLLFQAYKEKQPPDPILFNQILLQDNVSSALQLVLERQWDLLAVLLMWPPSEETASLYQDIHRFLLQMESVPYWQGFQLFASLNALNRFLAGMATDFLEPLQLEGGAAALEVEGRWPFAVIPHASFQAQLGLVWALLAGITKEARWLEAACRLARWHLHLLDACYQPLVGLFSRQSDASSSGVLMDNYLLFHAVALLSRDPLIAYAAEKQLEYLHTLPAPSLSQGHWIRACLIQESLDTYPSVTPVASALPEVIEDASAALGGIRWPDGAVVCTLQGGGTTMGSFKHHEMGILAYGPHWLPLGDCHFFGIEGREKAVVEASASELCLKGRARIVAPSHDPHPQAFYCAGGLSGAWLEAKQEARRGCLSIDVSFVTIHTLDTLAFVFFIKADSCDMPEEMTIRPRSLNRYQGQVRPMTFRKKDKAIILTAGEGCVDLQVIPLAGQDSFWGGDFLVAYRLQKHLVRYKWDVTAV